MRIFPRDRRFIASPRAAATVGEKSAEAFGGGIGGSKCACGALTGGVMALALRGKGKLAGKLAAAFKEKNGVACCAALTRPYAWKSPEHLANCRRITEETAELTAVLLQDQP